MGAALLPRVSGAVGRTSGDASGACGDASAADEYTADYGECVSPAIAARKRLLELTRLTEQSESPRLIRKWQKHFDVLDSGGARC